MKKNNTYLRSKLGLWLAFLIVSSSLILSSCKKDEEFSGTPLITKVRLINPAKKDSTFTSANPGTLILIEGQNLGGVTNVYFNDYGAAFNTVYNTNGNLIVTIPGNAPTEATNPNVSNKIRLVTTHGETTFDFVLNIPPPVISYIVNENALPGDSMIIVGSNLWLVTKITLPGNKEITNVVENAAGTRLGFIMPDLGTTAGVLTIQAKFGTVASAGPINLYASDGVISNLTASWESGEPSVFNWSWWGANRTTDASLFPGTRGAYLQSIFGGVGADDGGWWTNNRAGNFDPVAVVSSSDLGKPASDYALKFEVNTKEPWTTALCVLRFGDNYAYQWKPFETSTNNIFYTDNKWQTVTVPLSAFKTASGNPSVEGTGTNAVTLGNLLTSDGKASFQYRIISEDSPIDLFNTAFDNIRVVKIK